MALGSRCPRARCAHLAVVDETVRSDAHGIETGQEIELRREHIHAVWRLARSLN